tara:strand:+ start:300 stop:785 length:486 start_codon:yes stop_codon:yes gene_type:complete
MLICTYVLNHSANNTPNITQALQTLLVVHNEFEGNNDPLIVHSTSQPHQFLMMKKNGAYHFVHSLKELVQSDKNKNNIIDHTDPVYETLYVATLDQKTQKLGYLPLHKTFINAINLSPKVPNKIVDAADVIIPNNHQDSPNFHLIINPELFPETEITRLNS